MPELPEVETIRRVLSPQIKGRTIQEILVHRPEVIAHPSAEAFRSQVTGQTISDVGRRGKFLTIALASDARIVIHLRMTGCLLLAPEACPQEKHTHVVFKLSDGNELRFSDTRRFGRLWLIREGEEGVCSSMDRLGIEPFDEALTPAYLCEKVSRCKKAVKECLLDQHVVAGIGNIYADEILFATGIHPTRSANSLTEQEWTRLAAAIPERLAYFAEKNQISPEEYLYTKGRDYRNTPFLQVYGRIGKPCLQCGEPLCKTVVGGRSSMYCPNCQLI